MHLPMSVLSVPSGPNKNALTNECFASQSLVDQIKMHLPMSVLPVPGGPNKNALTNECFASPWWTK